MAVPTCRAKDPNSCRVHGSGGTMQHLQSIADKATQNKDMSTYIKTRAMIDSLDENGETPTFILPDTGNLTLKNFMSKDGEILREAPNDMLIRNLSDPNLHDTPEHKAITSVLEGRGWDESSLLLAKHFGFRKDEESWEKQGHSITLTQLENASGDIEKKHGVTDMSAVMRYEFIHETFDFDVDNNVKANSDSCKKFVENYEKIVAEYKEQEESGDSYTR